MHSVQATGSTPTVEAERQDDSPTAFASGDDSDQPTREIHTPTGGDSLAEPGICTNNGYPARATPRFSADSRDGSSICDFPIYPSPGGGGVHRSHSARADAGFFIDARLREAKT